MLHFSELSRRALHGAEQLAEQYHHDRVGLAHLLHTLAHERRSVCSRILAESGLDQAALAHDLSCEAVNDGGSLGNLIERASVVAHDCGSHYLGTDHLLLALLLQPGAEALLRRYGAAPEEIERRIQSQVRPSLSTPNGSSSV